MKFVCPVCGYVEEFDGDQLPEDFKCPPVRRSRFSFPEAGGGASSGGLPSTSWASPRWRASPRTSLPTCAPTFEGECSEVGMYWPWLASLIARATRDRPVLGEGCPRGGRACR